MSIYNTESPQIRLVSGTHEDVPPIEGMTHTEARLWLNFVCYYYGYEQAMIWPQVANIINDEYTELRDKAVPARTMPAGVTNIDVARYAKNHFLALQRHAIGDKRMMATEAFRKDFGVTEDMLRLAVQAAAIDPDMINEVVAVLKRRAQMMGYDAPSRISLVGSGDGEELSEQDRLTAEKQARWLDEYEAKLLEDGSGSSD